MYYVLQIFAIGKPKRRKHLLRVNTLVSCVCESFLLSSALNPVVNKV